MDGNIIITRYETPAVYSCTINVVYIQINCIYYELEICPTLKVRVVKLDPVT